MKDDPVTKKRLLTVEEIASILKISLNTVHNKTWQKRNGCPLLKIGRRNYAMESAFWKWVNEKGMISGLAAH